MFLNDILSLIADNVLTLVLASGIIVLLCYFRFFRDPPKYPPGPFRWPIFGNLFLFGGGKDFYAVLKDIQKKYGDVFSIKIGQSTMILVFGHKNLSKCMVDNGDNVKIRPDWLFNPKVLMKQKGLLWANGEKWEKLSKLIRQSQMNKNVLLNMERQLNEELKELCKCFSADIAVNPLDHFYNINLNIVSSLVFGKRFSYDDPDFKHMSKRLKFIMDNMKNRKEPVFSWIAYFTRSELKLLTALGGSSGWDSVWRMMKTIDSNALWSDYDLRGKRKASITDSFCMLSDDDTGIQKKSSVSHRNRCGGDYNGMPKTCP